MIEFKELKVKLKDGTDSAGIFEISPLPRGYGNTLANSLRRILLSSLDGAAITSIKVKGVDHEYSTVEGMKEDLVEVILNLKQIKFKLTSEDPQVCTIDVSGEKEITADDFKLPAGIEVVNSDAHVATLTTKDSALSMEVVVEKGVGYKPASQDERSEVGRIPVDADFTPIKKVSITVISARKGNKTDLDGVLIDLETDGSINPNDALLRSATILQDFSGKVMAALGVPITEVEEMAEASQEIIEEEIEEVGISDEVSAWKIEDLPISKRSKSGLLAGGYETIGDLKDITTSELLGLPGFGNKSLNEVVDLLNQYGIELKA